MILESGLQGGSCEATAEPGTKDLFLATGTATGDAHYGRLAGQRSLEKAIRQTLDSFQKFGWGHNIEIISTPDLPDEPVHLPHPPATGVPSQKPATSPVPVPETARLQTDVSLVKGVQTLKTRFITDTGEVFPSLAAAKAALNSPPPSNTGEANHPRLPGRNC